MIRIAPKIRCRGDVHAPGGVELGRCSVVEGDVYTDGTVELGSGAWIEGEIRPTSAADEVDSKSPESRNQGSPEGSPTVGSRTRAVEESTGPLAPPGRAEATGPGEIPSPRADRETRLETAALRSTMNLLLDLARDHGSRPHEGVTWGLEPDALEDMLKGVLVLVADVHLGDLPEAPWSRKIVEEVLLQRALATVTELTVERRGPDRLVLRMRPPPSWVSDDPEADWPATAASVVRHLGQAARPQLSVQRLEPDQPHEARLLVEL